MRGKTEGSRLENAAPNIHIWREKKKYERKKFIQRLSIGIENEKQGITNRL